MKKNSEFIYLNPSSKKGESQIEIILKNELTIFSIENVKDKIIDALKKYKKIDFDLKDITNIDLSFIQFFHSIKATAEHLKKEVTFKVDLSEDVESLITNSDLRKVML